MAKQKKLQQYIFKIDSALLRKNNWCLNLPLSRARKTAGVIVALADSQILSWINEMMHTEDYDLQAKEVKRQIKDLKKMPSSRENKAQIKKLYENLYRLQFREDYLCVIIDRKSDYDRANQGFYVNGVKYLRAICTTGGVKTSTVVYVSERVHSDIKKKIDNGRKLDKQLIPAKLGAYQALSASASIPVSWPRDRNAPIPGGVIVVHDCFTEFYTDLINIDDSDTSIEPVVQFVANQHMRNDCSDGCSMMLPSLSKRWNGELNGDYEHTMSGANLRASYVKGMTFTFDFIEFAEKVVGASEDCPDKYFITDVWGTKRDVREAELIITESQLKLWSSYDSWEDYYNKSIENGYTIRIAKTAPHVLDEIRQLNYQFIQSLDLTDDDIQELIAPTVNEIHDILGMDSRKTIVYLSGKNLNKDNVQYVDCVARAIMANSSVINDPYIRNRVQKMINKRIREAKIGVLDVRGNFQIIAGDLYALCERMFGLEVHGLLKAGELYSKFWIDRNVPKLLCFRAPMSNSHSIVAQKVCYSEKASYWFRYIDTCVVVNGWDSMPAALNGFDMDGDLLFTTDNQPMMRNQTNLPALNCIQYNAAKKIVTEEDIIQSNKKGFGSKIGSITNRITEMTSLMANYKKGSIEYETLKYRTQCGQAQQQSEIDKAKGIISTPMPKSWYVYSENRIKDGDSEEVKAKKMLNQRICAHKKPYFFGYNYPQLKKEYDQYVRTISDNIYSITGKNMLDLLKSDGSLPENEQKLVNSYKNHLPLDVSPSTMNRICWAVEREFDGNMAVPEANFDYNIYKSNVKYSKDDFELVKIQIKEYKKLKKHIGAEVYAGKEDTANKINDIDQLNMMFEQECFAICPNEKMLCDILLDLCYSGFGDTGIAWNMCGDVIVNNLLDKYGKLYYPEQCENGAFWCCGCSFTMKTIEAGGENND